ncbi:uncharacterized protein LOC129946481 isoform X2 [Eupeodes corollae]|uniref:uncharacterized protein LOC129946481 isoform X2 n=1 Tax=Eupeodes corollae TaxID=290404 RepID=UPI0024921105|nr:uncharacterized protein LOC129946481 isoform X2 [Eupeodes corollae]
MATFSQKIILGPSSLEADKNSVSSVEFKTSSTTLSSPTFTKEPRTNDTENFADPGVPIKPPRLYSSAVPISKETEKVSFRRSIKNDNKTRIRTIEELLDSSSDLDYPLLETPSPVLPTTLISTPPSSSSSPSTSRTPAPNEMSANKNIFCDNNGASNNDFCPTNLPNECMASTSSKAIETINYNEIRSNSISPTPTMATVTSTGLSGVISVNHYERLIEELKCPGCAYPMKAPIKLCATGHSICQNCTTVLMVCPLCKEPFIDLRSLTLEALCSKAHFRCSNAAAGCTVRLQIDLLNWHEKQCIWKSMKCFMGRVWGDCTWHGREAQWKDHLESVHTDRVFKTNGADLVWDMNGKIQSLAGYYVFEVFDEMFNFYQVHDRDRILFTMTVTSTVRDRKLNFAYEVEMFHKENEALVITQRFPVHSEYDKDILLDGTCVCVALTDLSRFMGQEKILFYRVRIHEIKSPKKNKGFKRTFRKHPIDFQQTKIEGANLKCVPAGVIVTRRPDDPVVTNKPSEKEEEEDDVDSSSEEDSEFEAYIEKNWGTPQMNFNRKYLRNYVSKESSSSSGSSNLSSSAAVVVDDGRVNIPQRHACEVSGTKTKMKNVTSSLRKSFRSLRTDIIDLKKPFTKSPEKKETLIKK